MDGGNKYGINNANSIGIEMCVNSDCTRDIMVQNTVELVAHLMKTYNIPLGKVVRHYDASRKNCPQTMNNNGDWSAWFTFKERVKKEYEKLMTPPAPVYAPWMLDAVKFLKTAGFINSPHNPDELVTMGTFAYMMNNYVHKLPTINPTEYLVWYGYTKSRHEPTSPLTWEILGYMLANRSKEITTDPVQFMLNKGYITSTKNPKDKVTFCLFGAVMVNATTKKLKI